VVEIAAIVRSLVDGVAGAVLVAVVAAGGTAAGVAAASVRVVAGIFLHPSTLLRKAKIAVLTAATIVAETAVAAADIRNAAATKIVVRGVILTAVRPTLPAVPRHPMGLPRSRLCCPANHWPNIADVRCPRLPLPRQ
jgi:hypothetical protein